MRFKIICLMFIVFVSVNANADGHKGLFFRFSQGLGGNTEFSDIDETCFTTPSKDHALGWKFNDMFALFINDFGGLIKNKVGEYNYINLDGLGPGITFYMPLNTYVSLSGGTGNVTFARKWWEIRDYGKDSGYAANFSLGKEWELSGYFGFQLGLQGFYFKTPKYEFVNYSINYSFTFYITDFIRRKK